MSGRKEAIAWRVDFRYTDQVRREGGLVFGAIPSPAQRATEDYWYCWGTTLSPFALIESCVELAVEVVGLIGEQGSEGPAVGGETTITSIDIVAIGDRGLDGVV